MQYLKFTKGLKSLQNLPHRRRENLKQIFQLVSTQTDFPTRFTHARFGSYAKQQEQNLGAALHLLFHYAYTNRYFFTNTSLVFLHLPLSLSLSECLSLSTTALLSLSSTAKSQQNTIANTKCIYIYE